MTTRAFLDHLEQQGLSVQRRGNGGRAQCPAHAGDGLNLAVDPGEKGGVLLTCHSRQCPAADIAGAVGLSLADLAPPSRNGHGPEEPEAVYDYPDEAGKLLFQVVR